jgi:WD40 repeat protein
MAPLLDPLKQSNLFPFNELIYHFFHIKSYKVCGLAWSPDGRYLASGGNDNLLNIWDATLSDEVSPLHTFSHHQAAVKVSKQSNLFPFNELIYHFFYIKSYKKINIL